jgi:hypothetical protein
LLDEMEAAAKSGLEGELTTARVALRIEDVVDAAPHLALDAQTQGLSPSKLKLVE